MDGKVKGLQQPNNSFLHTGILISRSDIKQWSDGFSRKDALWIQAPTTVGSEQRGVSYCDNSGPAAHAHNLTSVPCHAATVVLKEQCLNFPVAAVVKRAPPLLVNNIHMAKGQGHLMQCHWSSLISMLTDCTRCREDIKQDCFTIWVSRRMVRGSQVSLFA